MADIFDEDAGDILAVSGLRFGIILPILFVILLTLIFFFALTHLLLDGILSNSPNENSISVSVSLISIFINGLLTFGILLIYRNIRSAEEGQEKLMEQQKDLLEEQTDLRLAKNQPKLSFKSLEVDGSWISVLCHNDGTGRAQNIEFDIELYVGNSIEGFPIKSEIQLTPISKIGRTEMITHEQGEIEYREGFNSYVDQIQYATDDKRRAAQAAIDAGDSEKFRFKFSVNHYSGTLADATDGKPISFKNLSKKLTEGEYSYDVIGYRISMQYHDIIENNSTKKLLSSGYAELKSGIVFEDVYNSSEGHVTDKTVFGNRIIKTLVDYS